MSFVDGYDERLAFRIGQAESISRKKIDQRPEEPRFTLRLDREVRHGLSEDGS